MNQFDFVQDAFYSGHPIIVMKDGLWGLMDKNENILIPPKYDYIRNFVNGFAAVQRNGLWGFVNEKGEEIVAPKYISAENFTIKKLAVVQYFNSCNIVNENGVELLSKEYTSIKTTKHPIVFVRDGFGFLHVYDTSTNTLKKMQCIHNFKPLNDYYYLIQNNQSLVGLLNSNGDTVLECKYNSINPINDWLYAVYDCARDCFVYNSNNNSLNYVGNVIIEDVVVVGDEFYLTFFDKEGKIHFIDTINYMIVLNKYCDKIIENIFGTLKVEINDKTGYLYL